MPTNISLQVTNLIFFLVGMILILSIRRLISSSSSLPWSAGRKLLDNDTTTKPDDKQRSC